MPSEVILIIDDNLEVTESLGFALEREDRLIITCNDAESASVIIDHHELTFIVSDINFSGPFGFEGLDIVTMARKKTPPVPIALITGAVSSQLREEAQRLGVVDILEKPFDTGDLERLFQARKTRT